MGKTAGETAIELVQIADNAGLAKGVIALLEGKAALLTQQVTRLEIENANLKAELKRALRQSEELSPDTIKMLKLFFDRANDISIEEILKSLDLKPGVVEYHIEILLKKKLIKQTGMQSPLKSSVSTFGLTALGRRYVLENATN